MIIPNGKKFIYYFLFVWTPGTRGTMKEKVIFTVFGGNGGIFAWKVKFTVFTVKNVF